MSRIPDRSQQTDIFIAWKDRDDNQNGKLTSYNYLFPQAIITNLPGWIQSMTEAEEKFAKYFKVAYDKAIDISQMSYEQLDMWIDELEDIILTAKASVQGASLGQRERKAKLSASEKEKTRSGDSTINVSDAMSAVRKRTERMSKMDKLKAMYDDMVDKGTMSREDADSMLGLVKVDESKQSTMSFNKDKAETIDTAKLAQQVVDGTVKEEAKPSEAFDVSSLFK